MTGLRAAKLPRWTVDARTGSDTTWTEVLETRDFKDAARKTKELRALGEEVVIRKNGHAFAEFDDDNVSIAAGPAASGEFERRFGERAPGFRFDYAHVHSHSKGHHKGVCDANCRRAFQDHGHRQGDRAHRSRGLPIVPPVNREYVEF